MGPQRDEPFGLGPVTAGDHSRDRWFEVVIPDPGGHPTEVRERQHMTFQERLLRLVAERDVKRPT